MNVGATDTTGAASPLYQAKPSASMVDYQTFLKLLIAEMKNQDPTNPMKSHEYVAQLASFSQVEQSVQINKKLDEMIQAQTISQATGLIGKEVEAMDGTIKGAVVEVKLYSDGVVVKLDSGDEVVMGPGVIVRDRPAQQDEGA